MKRNETITYGQATILWDSRCKVWRLPFNSSTANYFKALNMAKRLNYYMSGRAKNGN